MVNIFIQLYIVKISWSKHLKVTDSYLRKPLKRAYWKFIFIEFHAGKGRFKRFDLRAIKILDNLNAKKGLGNWFDARPNVDIVQKYIFRFRCVSTW